MGTYVPGEWKLLHPATSPGNLCLVPSVNLRNAHLTLLSGEGFARSKGLSTGIDTRLNHKAVISLSVCTCTHVRTSTFFGFLVHVCCYAKYCFSDGFNFCLLVHIKRVFSAHARVCTLENDYRSTCLHVYMLHGCIFSPKNMHPCNM